MLRTRSALPTCHTGDRLRLQSGQRQHWRFKGCTHACPSNNTHLATSECGAALTGRGCGPRRGDGCRRVAALLCAGCRRSHGAGQQHGLAFSLTSSAATWLSISCVSFPEAGHALHGGRAPQDAGDDEALHIPETEYYPSPRGLALPAPPGFDDPVLCCGIAASGGVVGRLLGVTELPRRCACVGAWYCVYAC